MKLDIIKEGREIFVFQVLGYTKQRQTRALYLGKMLEILLSYIIGSIAVYNVWNYLCSQKIFLGLMTMMDEKTEFQLFTVWIVLLIFTVWSFLIVFWVIKSLSFYIRFCWLQTAKMIER